MCEIVEITDDVIGISPDGETVFYIQRDQLHLWRFAPLYIGTLKKDLEKNRVEIVPAK